MSSAGRYPCPQCNKSYQHRGTLRLHLNRECGKEPSLFCSVPLCHYKTKIKGNLKRHMITRHGLKDEDLRTCYNFS